MIVEFKIPDSLKLSDFSKILSKYNSFKSINRDLKINSILGDKKMELEITDIKPSKIGFFSDVCINPNLIDSSFKINKMIVGIQNYKVLYFKCDIDPLKTEKGKILSNLIGASELKFRILMSGTIDDFQLEDEFFVTI